MRISTRITLLGVVLLLGACGKMGIRPVIISDSAPPGSVSAIDIKDAIPRADPIRKSGNKSPYQVFGVDYQVMTDATGYRETGVASWYGRKFHGRPTSNGETFNSYSVTAAHRSLPIPCYVRVRNLDNDRQLVVRVNDRGPFHADRIIDLSYAAAVKLGFADHGTARVEVELIPLSGVQDLRFATVGSPWRNVSVQPNRAQYLQLGAFSNEDAALRLVARLGELTKEPVGISELESGTNTLYRVRVGPVGDTDGILTLRDLLIDKGFEAPRLLVD
jgi:rare lipoprotein A